MALTFDEIERNRALRNTTGLPDLVVIKTYEIGIFTGKTEQKLLIAFELFNKRIAQCIKVILHQTAPPNTSTPLK